MAKKPETKFGEQVDKDLKRTFGKSVWVENIQQVGKCGTPDRLVCLNGKFVGLELKTDVGDVDRLQLVKLLEIKKAGGIAYVVYPATWSTILKELQELFLR